MSGGWQAIHISFYLHTYTGKGGFCGWWVFWKFPYASTRLQLVPATFPHQVLKTLAHISMCAGQNCQPPIWCARAIDATANIWYNKWIKWYFSFLCHRATQRNILIIFLLAMRRPPARCPPVQSHPARAKKAYYWHSLVIVACCKFTHTHTHTNN